MKLDGFPERVWNLSNAPFSEASAGMRSSKRLQRRSRFLRRQDCDFLILIATSISTCSHLFSKSLGAMPAGWIMFGFGILLALGENHRMRHWGGGRSGLV